MVTQSLVDLSRLLSNALATPTPVTATQEAGSHKFALITFHGPLPSSGTLSSCTAIAQPSPTSLLFYGGWLLHCNLAYLPDAIRKGISRGSSSYLTKRLVERGVILRDGHHRAVRGGLVASCLHCHRTSSHRTLCYLLAPSLRSTSRNCDRLTAGRDGMRRLKAISARTNCQSNYHLGMYLSNLHMVKRTADSHYTKFHGEKVKEDLASSSHLQARVQGLSHMSFLRLEDY